MRKNASPPLFFGLIFLLAVNAYSQETTLEEGLDTDGISWEVAAGPLPPGSDPLELSDENYWHGVADESRDGVDSVSVTLPADREAHSDLSTVVQAPVQFSFWYKTDPEATAIFEPLWYPQGSNTVPQGHFPRSESWKQYTGSIREDGNYVLKFIVQSTGQASDWTAWMDQFTLTQTFPPDITYFPERVAAPLGKDIRLCVEAEGYGELKYRWFREGAEISGQTGSSLLLPASVAESAVEYQVEVSDGLGSVMSEKSVVQFMSINEALDNGDLVFTFPDIPSQNYSDMIVLGSEAYDGENAVFLRECGRNCLPQFIEEYLFTPEFISTEIQGPAILNFYQKGDISFFLNEVQQNPHTDGYKYQYEQPATGDWKKVWIPIPAEGVNLVKWDATLYPINYGTSGMVDQISISHEPVFFPSALSQSTVVGIGRLLQYEAVSLGHTIHQLLRDDEVVLESNNEPLNLQNLEVEDSGTYRVKLISEYGETLSDPMEIIVYDTIGAAVEQPGLTWEYEGESLWIPQIYETYDGEDAAGTLDQSNEYGAVFTTINGPAFLTFWWKQAANSPPFQSQFRVNGTEMVLNHPGGGWKQEKVLLPSETNELKWFTGFFDQVKIEYLEDDPFKLWAFQKFDEDEILLNYAAVRNGDRDHDGFSNLVEWALNKNLDFPNQSLGYEILEIDGERYLAITFSRPGDLGAYSIHLQATSDFINWELTEAVVSETYHAVNDTYTITLRDTRPLSEGARFIRLQVSEE